jgi:hypothetical protein
MATKDYNRAESKKSLLDFSKEMAAAWEDFLTFKDAVSVMLEDIRENETEESYKAIVNEVGFSKEDADAMIAAYQEDVSNGQDKKQNRA